MMASRVCLVGFCFGAVLLQAAADIALNSSAEECGSWVEGKDFYGFDIRSADSPSREHCRSSCSTQPGCNAVTLLTQPDTTGTSSVCFMKQVPEGYEPVDLPVGDVLRLCANETTPGPAISVYGDEAPPPGEPMDLETCGEWLWDYTVGGRVVFEVSSAPIVQRFECLNLCVDTPPCNTALFNYRKKLCRFIVSDTDAQARHQPDWEVMRLCPIEQQPDCGVWLTNEDITGYDIPGAGTDGNSGLAVSNNACMLRCQNTAGCNAVVFKKYSKQCWMKKAPDEGLRLEPVANDESDSILLCPSQTFSAMAPETQSDTAGEPETTSDTAVERSSDGSTRESIGKQSKGVMSAGVMAGIIVAVLLGLICSAVIVVWVLVRQRAESKRTGANQGDGVASSYLGSGAVSSGVLGSTTITASGSYPIRVAPPSSRQMSTGSRQMSTGLLEISPALQERNVSTEVTAELVAQQPFGAPTRFQPGATSLTNTSSKSKNYATWQLPTTTWEMTVPPVPGEGSTKDQLMAFLHNQLDRIEAAVHHGRQGELLGGLRFTGSGPQDRLQGGQAIVQMAYSSTSRIEYAIKFFVARSAFEQEKSLYCGQNPLGQFLPQVRTILDNDDRQLVDPAGHALPPCIVMERGEALDLWSERNAPDRAQAFTVIYHIAQRLVEFHASGFVHRDLKPGNVMWLPRTNRWTVIDFGCAAHRRQVSPIAYTLRYAAPEVIRAKRSGEGEMVLEESLDAWSLGVMAFEMCTGSPPFPRGVPAETIMDQIEGVNGEMLPWEGERLTPNVRSKLRLFQDALLQLLHRDPEQRPSMKQFCRTCAGILGDNSVAEGEE